MAKLKSKEYMKKLSKILFGLTLLVSAAIVHVSFGEVQTASAAPLLSCPSGHTMFGDFVATPVPAGSQTYGATHDEIYVRCRNNSSGSNGTISQAAGTDLAVVCTDAFAVTTALRTSSVGGNIAVVSCNDSRTYISSYNTSAFTIGVSQNQAWCTASGGTWVGSSCSCPSGAPFSGGGCKAAPTGASAAEVCTNSGGAWVSEVVAGTVVESCACTGSKVTNGSGGCKDRTTSSSGTSSGSVTGVDPPVVTRLACDDTGADGSALINCDARDLDCQDDPSNCEIINYLNDGVNIVSIMIIPVIIIMFVLAGIQYSAANGDPGKIGAARDKIYKAALALISFIFLWSFLQWLIPGGQL